MRIVTKVSPTKLREMCIKHNYYTYGDNEAYVDMLFRYDDMFHEVTGKEIEDLARDIERHSITMDTTYDIACYIYEEACYSFVVRGD